jgi:deoxyribodipyrimidine photo-lyase
MSSGPIIVWFRQDLRLAANPALAAAARTGRPIVPLYILDDSGPWGMGGASKWWLHHSLTALSADLAARGSALVLRRGESSKELDNLIQETGASAVYWNRQYGPDAIRRDTQIKASCAVSVQSFNGSLLHEPSRLKTQTGGSFQVFTPFFRALSATLEPTEIDAAPKRIAAFASPLATDALERWGLLPRHPNWATGFETVWMPGEAGAQEKLKRFLAHGLKDYATRRDLPGDASTSRLSPHLHFGEISPWQVWRAIDNALAAGEASADDARKFQSELAWREFSHHLLFHAPHLPDRNLRPGFDTFPWDADGDAYRAWTKGRTGIPIVDAGMRELWATGWMHNRVRMIAASFLVKNLLIDWRRGAQWFWDTLVDADLANNSASWQWVAGCGADAAPYFRIFNPVLQSRKFDPGGVYLKTWLPELSGLDREDVHAPWETGTSTLRRANVELGRTYPRPIVDLAASRARALDAFARSKSAA